MQNVQRILCGLAIVHNQEGLYTLCSERLAKNSLGSWQEAKIRTDEPIRQMLNLTLQSAIFACKAVIAEQTLTWARANTLMLQVND